MQSQPSPRRGLAWLRVPFVLLTGVLALSGSSARADDGAPPANASSLAKNFTNSLPGWAKDWTVGGDLRLRYDRQDYGAPIGPEMTLTPGQNNININVPPGSLGSGTGLRERFQARLRVGAEKLLGEDFKAGFRIVTSESTSCGPDTNITGTAPCKLTS